MSGLDCPVCCNKYNSTANLPTVLPCGHTFCKTCSSKIHICPLDRQKITKEEPPANFALCDLITRQFFISAEAIHAQVVYAAKFLSSSQLFCLKRWEDLACAGDFDGYFNFLHFYLMYMKRNSFLDDQAGIFFQGEYDKSSETINNQTIAAYHLAVFYEEGRGGYPKLPERALALYQWIANHYRANNEVRYLACLRLATCYKNGELGCSKSIKSVKEYLRIILDNTLSSSAQDAIRKEMLELDETCGIL